MENTNLYRQICDLNMGEGNDFENTRLSNIIYNQLYDFYQAIAYSKIGEEKSSFPKNQAKMHEKGLSITLSTFENETHDEKYIIDFIVDKNTVNFVLLTDKLGNIQNDVYEKEKQLKAKIGPVVEKNSEVLDYISVLGKELEPLRRKGQSR